MAIAQRGDSADIAVANIAKKRDAAVRENLGVGDFVGNEPDRCEFLDIDFVDAAGVAGRREGRVLIED